MHININNYFLKGDYMKNLKSYREYLEYVYANEFSIGNMLPQVPLNEKSNKVVKNDKGQIVPTACPKCGSKIAEQINGAEVILFTRRQLLHLANSSIN